MNVECNTKYHCIVSWYRRGEPIYHIVIFSTQPNHLEIYFSLNTGFFTTLYLSIFIFFPGKSEYTCFVIGDILSLLPHLPTDSTLVSVNPPVSNTMPVAISKTLFLILFQSIFTVILLWSQYCFESNAPITNRIQHFLCH